MLIHC
jgi:hypothetical protein